MYQLSILKNPVGTYSFVGSVPADLAIECTPGREAEAYKTVHHAGMHIARKIAEREGWKVNTRSFPTEEAARTFAASKGYSI